MVTNIHDPIETEAQDDLDRRFLAERILRRICDESCPSVIGLYGGWGTGKTSLLNLVRAKNNTPETRIIYLDAWQYEGAGNLLVPVIVALRGLVGTSLPQAGKAMAERVLLVTGLSLLGAALPVKLGDVQANLKEAESRSPKTTASLMLDWERLSDEILNTSEAFAILVSAACQEQKCKRVVLCIDNLDRCSPDAVVDLLASVKNFLSVPGCIWIFAMDAEVVASYIDHKYTGTAMDGNSYLDKIIPEQYHLSFFPERHDHRIFDLISKVAGKSFALNNEGRLPQLPRVMVPRRLKKTAGKFAEFFALGQTHAERDTVFLLILLYYSWPDFYERLSSPSEDHIGGILANFFGSEQLGVDANHQKIIWGGYEPLPLRQSFLDENDLAYFLQIAFPDRQNAVRLVADLKRTLDGLRQIGLP